MGSLNLEQLAIQQLHIVLSLPLLAMVLIGTIALVAKFKSKKEDWNNV